MTARNGKQPEDRAAVDDDQEHARRAARSREEGAVDLLEHLDLVRGRAGAPADGDLESAGAVADHLANVLGGVEEAIVVGVLEHEVDREQGGGPVLGHGGLRNGLCRGRRVLVQLLPVALDEPLVLGREAPVALVDRERVQVLAGGELALEVVDRERLAVAGQEAGGLVLLRVLELARLRAGNSEGQDHADHEDHPLAAAAGGECEEVCQAGSHQVPVYSGTGPSMTASALGQISRFPRIPGCG